MTVDLRSVIRQLGLLLLVLCALILICGVFALLDRGMEVSDRRAEWLAFAVTSVVGGVVAGLLVVLGRASGGSIGQRDAVLLVVLSWIAGGGVAALPYRFWAALRTEPSEQSQALSDFANCFFESVSGLTTTGASVLSGLESLPRSLLLWRSLTQWLGGLGIVVLFVAVLPLLGVGGKRLFRMEVTGPSKTGLMPRIQDAARVLWKVYLSLTALEILTLRICGLSWFDAVCHTFATLSTGGFGTRDASVAAFESPAVDVCITVFMIVASINFGLYYQLKRGEWRRVVRDPELLGYLGLLVVSIGWVTFSLARAPEVRPLAGTAGTDLLTLVRYAAFQVATVSTETGFATADFDQWPVDARLVLMVMMVVGGCAGSTSGGIKVVRWVVAWKVVVAVLERVYRPQVVRAVRLGPSVVEPDQRLDIFVFILFYLGMLAIGAAGIMVFESGAGIDVTTAATATMSSLGNCGPGLARVGPTQNYAWLSDLSKYWLSGFMILGRLEILTIVVLFTPRFWRSE